MTEAPDRKIGGLAPRAGEPDLSRLQRRNRPEKPAAKAAEKPPAGAEPAAPAPAQTAPIPAPARPTTAAPVASQENARMTTYLSAAVRDRARAAYKATAHLENDRSWSAFVEAALLAETLRREERHNGGAPYAGGQEALAPGRPLS